MLFKAETILVLLSTICIIVYSLPKIEEDGPIVVKPSFNFLEETAEDIMKNGFKGHSPLRHALREIGKSIVAPVDTEEVKGVSPEDSAKIIKEIMGLVGNIYTIYNAHKEATTNSITELGPTTTPIPMANLNLDAHSAGSAPISEKPIEVVQNDPETNTSQIPSNRDTHQGLSIPSDSGSNAKTKSTENASSNPHSTTMAIIDTVQDQQIIQQGKQLFETIINHLQEVFQLVYNNFRTYVRKFVVRIQCLILANAFSSAPHKECVSLMHQIAMRETAVGAISLFKCLALNPFFLTKVGPKGVEALKNFSDNAAANAKKVGMALLKGTAKVTSKYSKAAWNKVTNLAWGKTEEPPLVKEREIGQLNKAVKENLPQLSSDETLKDILEAVELLVTAKGQPWQSESASPHRPIDAEFIDALINLFVVDNSDEKMGIIEYMVGGYGLEMPMLIVGEYYSMLGESYFQKAPLPGIKDIFNMLLALNVVDMTEVGLMIVRQYASANLKMYPNLVTTLSPMVLEKLPDVMSQLQTLDPKQYPEVFRCVKAMDMRKYPQALEYFNGFDPKLFPQISEYINSLDRLEHPQVLEYYKKHDWTTYLNMLEDFKTLNTGQLTKLLPYFLTLNPSENPNLAAYLHTLAPEKFLQLLPYYHKWDKTRYNAMVHRLSKLDLKLDCYKNVFQHFMTLDLAQFPEAIEYFQKFPPLEYPQVFKRIKTFDPIKCPRVLDYYNKFSCDEYVRILKHLQTIDITKVPNVFKYLQALNPDENPMVSNIFNSLNALTHPELLFYYEKWNQDKCAKVREMIMAADPKTNPVILKFMKAMGPTVLPEVVEYFKAWDPKEYGKLLGYLKSFDPKNYPALSNYLRYLDPNSYPLLVDVIGKCSLSSLTKKAKGFLGK